MAKKKKYIVTVREVHHQPYMVMATSKNNAIAVMERNNDDECIILEDLFCYSHTLSPSTWTVEETK